MTENNRPAIQDIVSSWWESSEEISLSPGRLALTFAPFPDVVTRGLVIEGREIDTDHSSARFRVEPIKSGSPPKLSSLPVAALPTNPGESYVAQRGKTRPVLVLGSGGVEVPRQVLSGGPGYQRKAFVLVAPYYGTAKDGKRAGFPPEFIDRVRCGQYPQFMLDYLPPGNVESLLRFDHAFPVGDSNSNFKLLPFCLSCEALELTWDWLQWVIEGCVPENSLLETARSLIQGL